MPSSETCLLTAVIKSAVGILSTAIPYPYQSIQLQVRTS
jgi:hypothetical protein